MGIVKNYEAPLGAQQIRESKVGHDRLKGVAAIEVSQTHRTRSAFVQEISQSNLGPLGNATKSRSKFSLKIGLNDFAALVR
jgi:hypothetical protein